MKIPFFKTAITGQEQPYIQQVLSNGDSFAQKGFIAKCETWFAEHNKLKNFFLTKSCSDALELATFGASLGGVRTTTQVPATMAFLDVPPEEKARMNIRDGMCRVSLGLEDPADIIADFDHAVKQI